MSLYPRDIGEPLRLGVCLTDCAPDRFVRAYLYDHAGQPLTPATVDLVSSNNGLYWDDGTVLMPNLPRVIVKYKVFADAGFTVPDDFYEATAQCFEISKFDPALIQPVQQSVFGRIEQETVTAMVSEGAEVEAWVGVNLANVKVGDGQTIEADIIEEQTIKGVVSE